jgi:TRAP-type C4-dicarboxylate transport system permease small subunit
MEMMRRVADRLISLSALIGAAGLSIEMAVILLDVVGRAFGSPLYGSHDIVTMTMVILVFGGMALCDYKGGHIAVDLFEHLFPAGFNRAVDVFSAGAGAVIFAGIVWTVFDSAKISVMLNLQTNLLHLPKAWFQWALCVMALITSFAMLLRAIELAFRGLDVRRTGEVASR